LIASLQSYASVVYWSCEANVFGLSHHSYGSLLGVFSSKYLTSVDGLQQYNHLLPVDSPSKMINVTPLSPLRRYISAGVAMPDK